MILLCLGLSHRTASLALRETLSLSDGAVRDALDRFREWGVHHLNGNTELVILSTCNRLELYLAAPGEHAGDSASTLASFTAELCGVPVAQLKPYLYQHDQAGAVQHLCRVAAGLDSMVLGESQILGQVGDALDIALQAGSAGPALASAFRVAIRAGRRAQTETTIGRNPASVGSVAVRLAEQVVGPAALLAARVLVVGAGVMAELVIKALRARGITQLAVANRTRARADVLAQRWGGVAFDLEQLDVLLAQAHVVITSTGAPEPVICREQVQRAMNSREGQPLVLIDTAVPRDIEPAAGDIPHVRLFNLDDLQAHVDVSVAERLSQVPLAEAIVDQELRQFRIWLRSAEIRPVIADLRRWAEEIRQHELQRALLDLQDLDPGTRDYIQGLTRALVNKLLHEPTSRLRAAARDDRADIYAQSVRYLFDLNGDGSRPPPNPNEP